MVTTAGLRPRVLALLRRLVEAFADVPLGNA